MLTVVMLNMSPHPKRFNGGLELNNANSRLESGDSPSQALLERIACLEAEQPRGFGNVNSVSHRIAGNAGLELNSGFSPGYFLEGMRDFQNAGFFFGSDVENFPDGFLALPSGGCSRNSVLHESKLSRLPSAPENLEGFSAENGLDELRNDCGIGNVPPLSRAVNANVPQYRASQTVQRIVNPAVFIASSFSDAVRMQGAELLVFAIDFFSPPVNAGRGSENNFGNVVGAARFQNVESSRDVDFIRLERVLDASHCAVHCSKVENGIRVSENFFEENEVPNVPLGKSDSSFSQERNVLPPDTQIVDNQNLVSPHGKRFAQVASDETGAAGYDEFHSTHPSTVINPLQLKRFCCSTEKTIRNAIRNS